MRSKFGLLLIASAALAGCSYHAQQGDLADRGVEPVNVPVVSRTDYVFDAAAPGGSLGSAEQARLDAWFRGLGLGYGDSIYIDATYADTARFEVAQIAGKYGMLLEHGAPVTAGAGRTRHGAGHCQPVACRGSGLPQLEPSGPAELQQPHDVKLRLRREFEHRSDGRQSGGPDSRP